jgi:hypothetical protein
LVCAAAKGSVIEIPAMITTIAAMKIFEYLDH